MAFPIATNVVTAQITPMQADSKPNFLKVNLELRNHAGPIEELVTVQVLVEVGNHTLGALQEKAVARAALLLANAMSDSQSTPQTALSTWAKLAE